MRPIILLCLAALLLGGCANQTIQRKDGRSSARAFTMADLAKGEVDLVTELNQREVLNSLRLLTEKLYRRNPQEYRKAGLESAELATARIFDELAAWPETPLASLDWADSFKQAFLDGYAGDRVHAFMGALVTMVMASYNHKTAFYLADELMAQKLYNSARNVEAAVWKLSNARLANGGRCLLTNSMDAEAQNLSFEREFGKIIAQQDLLALIIEDRGNRSISRVLQNAAAFVFLPI